MIYIGILYGLMVYIVAVLPSLFCLILAFKATSWRKWVATLLAAISGMILAFEIYSSSLGGNLTGLIWMLSLPFVTAFFVIVVITEWIARRMSKSIQDQGN